MAAKKKAKATATVRPVKEKLTKSALLRIISEKTELSRVQVANVLGELEAAMLGSVHPNGAGVFMFPGLFKVALRKVPLAKPARSSAIPPPAR
jgi:hypothetical protein